MSGDADAALPALLGPGEAPPTPQWRPRWHCTPPAQWMNDPNGLLWHGGVWHLHYQHHPASRVWGPMHWGHATSRDLLHWQAEPLALAPDERGAVFSGCLVVDAANRSGLAPAGAAAGPWVAVFTQHDDRVQPGLQTQGLAHRAGPAGPWTMHAGNPVLPNPGLQDFRDPKVFWHAPASRWVMVLAAGDHLRFYGSPDLQRWQALSRFDSAEVLGSGVWECPDLFELHDGEGHARWVLLLSVVKDGPNGGSAVQAWVGDFDGQRFTPEDPRPHWLDHGPDHYAAATFAGTAPRVLLIGWMSNWDYALRLPTAPWRGAMTLPRELVLRRLAGRWRVASRLPAEIASLGLPMKAWPADAPWPAPAGGPETGLAGGPHSPFASRLDTWLDGWLAQGQGTGLLQIEMAPAADAPADGPVALSDGDLQLELRSAAGDLLRVALQASAGRWVVDRRGVGDPALAPPGFAREAVAPRQGDAPPAFTLVLDRSSVELLADDGLSLLTALVFPRAPFDSARLRWGGAWRLASLRVAAPHDAAATSPAGPSTAPPGP